PRHLVPDGSASHRDQRRPRPSPGGGRGSRFRHRRAPRGQQMSETSPVLQLTGISKRFGAVQALTDVDLALFANEVHALVGENGAGKSTLVKILAGIHQPDAGHMRLKERELVLSGPTAARAFGIAVIHP